MNQVELHNKFIKTVEVLKNIKGSHIDVAKVWGVKLNAVLLNDEKSWLTINLVIGGKYHCSIQRPNEILYGIEEIN